MNSIICLCVLGLSFAAGAHLGAYLPPRGSAGSGAGVIAAPGFGAGIGGAGIGAGAYNAGRYTGGGGFGGGGAYSHSSGAVIPIVSYVNNPNQGDGSYSYSYSTGNGIQAGESGGVSGPESGTAAQGSYSYTGTDGQTYTVTYTADANGFVAQGAHLPTPPPIPEAILKSLAFNAANPQSEYDTGAYTSGGGAYRPGGGGAYRPGGGGAYRPAPSFSASSGYHYRK